MFIDSHAHFDRVLQNNKSEILDHNINNIVHISLNPHEFIKNYPILSQYKKILFATGIYPDHVALPDFDEDKELSLLEDILTKYPHIALGEAGIDLKDDSYGTLEAQSMLFEKQIFLAEKLSLPIIIHSRFSFDHCYSVLSKYKTPAIVHCFSYSIKEAEQILNRGDYISFSGILTYKKSLALQEVARIVPLDRILFETDSPYLSPIPVRHKTNTPNYIHYIYEFFAKSRNITLEELCFIVQKNFTTIFNL